VKTLLFEKQWLHALSLVVLLGLLGRVSNLESAQTGNFGNLGSINLLYLAAGIAVTHQVFVWLCWRLELHHSLLTRLFGRYGFRFYATGFTILVILRVAAVLILAVINQGTLDMPSETLRALAIVALLPASYLFYSVKRYFGFRRALGLDHFDKSYRLLPKVREGIFRITPNGMYTFGFLLIWIPGLWFASTAALFAAMFNHLYIWVHYFATERPDMQRIYEVRR
tara:strand:+ start:10639 stop:11313 length:675 start_codon:yes stop_codon:yes gene_type:complete